MPSTTHTMTAMPTAADGQARIAGAAVTTFRTVATMVVRQDAEGHALTAGEQVSIEKAVYVSLCRRHWEEEMGRWPAPKP